MFYRINDHGNADVFETTGERATRIDSDVYPIDSQVSTRYEHAQGITLTVSDAEKIGIKPE